MSASLYDRIAQSPSGNLINFESVRRWIDSLPKEFFRRNGKVRYTVYLPELKRFIAWLSKEHGGEWDPDVLLQHRLDDLKSDEVIQRRWAEEQVQRYYKVELSLRKATAGPRIDELISESTKQGALTAIASFFKANYVPLTKLNVRKRAPRVTKDHWFTLDDIKAIHEIASPWERAYIITMLSLGLRRGDILWLAWNDIWPYIADAEDGEVVGPLDLLTEKYGIVARSFLSPDAVKGLKQLRAYQEERKRLGKYIFRNSTDTAFDEDHVNRRLKILFKRAGRKSRGLTVRTHGFRKMLYNELKNVGAPLDVRNMIVGKSVSEDIAAYVNGDELEKWFRMVLPRISLAEPSPETADVLRERMERLERIVVKQQEQVEHLTIQLDNILTAWIPAQNKIREEFERLHEIIPELVPELPSYLSDKGKKQPEKKDDT